MRNSLLTIIPYCSRIVSCKSLQLDQWVLCKIYHRTDKSSTISTPTIQLIQEEEPRTATEDVNDQITIDANNNQQFNHKGDDFVYQGDTHNVDNYMSSYNYPEQLPLQEPLSFVNSNPYANIATQSDSPNFHGDMQQIFSNNSDLYANITADCASLNMHSDPMDENELWTIVDYPKDGFHTDF
ncbi:hypothetical protein M5689_025352 [Euphorbia peplus]|nr:hypothetical protein M5689_025352 [Euphorbia peplus]